MEAGFEDAVGLYCRCMAGVVECLQRQMRVRYRRSIYTLPVVILLMIRQHLQPGGTLVRTVEALLGGAADPRLSGCERARQKRISRATCGYSHARQRLPKQIGRAHV